jgi:hypothetical protein
MTMSNDHETAVHGYSMGITTTTEVKVADWFTLGHHVGHANSDEQAQFLDGFATALANLDPAHRTRQIDYISRSGVFDTENREKVAVLLEDLVEYLRAAEHDATIGPV